MTIGLWINGKKYKFLFEGGWFKGNEFKLLQVSILENLPDHDWVIFGIQIAKFSIGLFLFEIVA